MPIFHSIWIRIIWQQNKMQRRTLETELCRKCYNMEIIVVHYYWCFCAELWARAGVRPLSTRIYRMLGVIHLNDNARSEQKRQISKKELWMEIGWFLSYFFSSQAMIGAGGATKWIYTHFSFFFSSTPTEYAMKLYVVFRVGIFSLNIFQLLCGRDGMKSFSERFFSNFFLFRFSGYRIHMDCVDRRLLKSIWLIASNICKNWQHKSNIFGRWNCHTQNRAGHASRDRGFEWKIKRWFCNCINTIVNSSETLSFFFVRFAFCILLLSSVGWHNECRKKNCANRFAPSHFGCVLVFFFR